MNQGETKPHADQPPEFSFKDWGFRIDRLFEVAYRFYKRNESKVFHPSFDVRNQMTALTLQARHGNFNCEKAPDIGVLDLVGKNRYHQWSLLNGMSKTEAKLKFICTLDEICPIFKAYAEAVKLSSTGQHGANHEGDDLDHVNVDNNNSLESDEQLQTIRTSLNRQTYSQFKSYADKQYPGDFKKQKDLISSLQEQYYQQYISQLQPNLSKKSQSSNSILSPATSESSGIQADDGSLRCDRNASTCNQVQSSLPIASSHEVKQSESQIESESKIPEGVIVNNPISEISQPSNLQNLISSQSQAPYPPSYSHADQSKEMQAMVRSSEKQLRQVGRIDMVQRETTENQLPQAKQYPVVEPRLIGKFESFPEPRPIQRSSNGSSLIINMFSSGTSNETREMQPQPKDLNITSPFKSLESHTSEPSSYPTQQTSPSQKNNSLPESLPKVSPPVDHVTSIPDAKTVLAAAPLSPPQSSQRTTTFEPQREVDTWSCGSSSGAGSPLQQSFSYEPLEQATIWTKKGVNEFKDSLIDDKMGGAYLVKQGTVLVIQVPTYPNGKYIYWEFATEEYDIGFGLDFVYEPHLEKPLALKIYEETDDEDEEDEEEIGQEAAILEAGISVDQKESVLRQRAVKVARAANTISIVPTYRRDSHEEVFVGRHRYPGQGYYLLKFDNTYSVLRSKSLFFRVCYFI